MPAPEGDSPRAGASYMPANRQLPTPLLARFCDCWNPSAIAPQPPPIAAATAQPLPPASRLSAVDVARRPSAVDTARIIAELEPPSGAVGLADVMTLSRFVMHWTKDCELSILMSALALSCKVATRSAPVALRRARPEQRAGI